MWSLFKKEITSFFSSITGYLVVGVFLTLTSLFLWVIPGAMNIIYSGYSSLEPLFYLAPWLYLFLVPAVTMRLFAEEKKAGTLELLFTRPVKLIDIVWAKYLGGLALVLISLLPTLIYFYSVVQLGNPPGNIDYGGTWGSFIGLLFLSGVYVAIGVFSSSLSDNQIVSFVIAVIISFIFYYGFGELANIVSGGLLQRTLLFLSIDEHYQSISRGLVDSRDIVYFISIILFFVVLTREKLRIM